MTPMMERFYQKRFEEAGTVYSYNLAHERPQVEYCGGRRFVKTPCFHCPECGTTMKRCNCGLDG